MLERLKLPLHRWQHATRYCHGILACCRACASSLPPSSSSANLSTPRLHLSCCRQVEWDHKDCWFAHCVMLNEEERKQFADKGLGIAHCPSSNARLASGEQAVPGLR